MVFDGFMPPEKTTYPFIYLADSQQVRVTIAIKQPSSITYQTIHIWNDSPKKRGTVSNMALKIKTL